jgi:hypothetical protein
VRFSLAGFQVIIIGRFWVITEEQSLAEALGLESLRSTPRR